MMSHLLQLRHAALAAVFAGALFFTVRTFFQPHYTACDFAVIYTATRAWLTGDNPYAEPQAMAIWRQAGGRADIMWENMPQEFGRTWLPILLIPPSFPLLVPLALLPAPLATALWAGLGGIIILVMWAALASLMGVKLSSAPALSLLAGLLVLAPLHECFVYGQPSLPSIGLILLGLVAATRGSDRAAGILLALATALKPQLGLAFVLFYLFSRRWRLMGTFVTTTLVLAVVAQVPMAVRGTPWLSTWLGNLGSAKAAGDINSASTEYSGRGHLLHLQVILHGLIEDRLLVNVLALAITAALAVLFAWHWRHRRRAQEREGEDVLLWASVVSILVLLPVYHRLYDATLMVVPLAWGISALHSRPRVAVPVLLFVATFVIPHPALARVVRLLAADPSTLWGPLWHGVIEPYRVWLLVLGYILLMRAVVDRVPRQHWIRSDVARAGPAVAANPS